VEENLYPFNPTTNGGFGWFIRFCHNASFREISKPGVFPGKRMLQEQKPEQRVSDLGVT
jgi:hypothetical protein